MLLLLLAERFGKLYGCQRKDVPLCLIQTPEERLTENERGSAQSLFHESVPPSSQVPKTKVPTPQANTRPIVRLHFRSLGNRWFWEEIVRFGMTPAPGLCSFLRQLRR
jgi:hypothetical protein